MSQATVRSEQQRIAPRLTDGPEDAARERLRRFTLIGGAVCVPFVIAHFVLAVILTPIFAGMYADLDAKMSSTFRLLSSLSDSGLLVALVLAADALVFLVAYLIARRSRPWVLLVPAALFALTAGSWIPWLYAPIFSSMNVVK